MKKILLQLVFSFLAVGLLFGSTIMILNNLTPTQLINLDNVSENYEVVNFENPDRMIYFLSEVYTKYSEEGNGRTEFTQMLDLDGTGMKMSVRNKKTNEIFDYEYVTGDQYYFSIDGEEIQCEDAGAYFMNASELSLQLYTDPNTLLTPRSYTAKAIVMMEDGEVVTHDVMISLMADPKSQLETDGTPSPTQSTPQTNNGETIEPTEEDEFTLPHLKHIWYDVHNPTNYSIHITHQDGNNLKLNIICTEDVSTMVANAEVNVTLENVHKYGTKTGQGKFEYVDSVGNTGTGIINISEEAIVLVISEETTVDKETGWGIFGATGVYY